MTYLFPEATVISSHQGREHTRANRDVQGRHDAVFAQLFPDVDFRGGRYTQQDMAIPEPWPRYVRSGLCWKPSFSMPGNVLSRE